MPNLRHPIMGCTCSEGWATVAGRATAMPAVHDCAYIVWRNSFVDRAEAAADEQAGPRPSSKKPLAERERWYQQWGQAYEAELQRLMAKFPFPTTGP